MKLDAIKLAVATVVIFAFVWITCSVLVIVVPGVMMQMSGHMLHADLGNMGWSMHWTGFVIGLFLWTLIPAALVWAIAALYNRLLD